MSTPFWAKALEDPETSKKKSSPSVLKYFSSLLEGWADWTLTVTMMRVAPSWAPFGYGSCHFFLAKGEDKERGYKWGQAGTSGSPGERVSDQWWSYPDWVFCNVLLVLSVGSAKISMIGSNTSSLESLLEMLWESDICSQSTSCSNKATAAPWFQMQKKWLILRRPQWRTKKELAQERCHAILK